MPDFTSLIRIGRRFLFGVTALSVAAVWLIPVEAIQDHAVGGAGDDPYSQFEAMGRAEALTWLLRAALPIGLVLFWPSRVRSERAARWLKLVGAGFARATGPGAESSSEVAVAGGGIRAWMLRGLCLAWCVLAIVHFVGAVDQRARDWAYYRLNSGPAVLPNISESNRMLIHYLSRATPDDARILILSDQKLFFVSYYLLPRRVYHPMHPDAEFVIPRPDQQRPLPAWRLSDLDRGYLDELNPDYIVEYFEGPEYVDADRLFEDAEWITFARELRGDSGYVPPFNVILRPWSREDAAP